MSRSERAELSTSEKGVFHSPWESAFRRVLTPFEEFIHRQTTSGFLLMATAVLALVLANSALAGQYKSLLYAPAGISIGGWRLQMTLHHWVNDGLMALFFLLVGLELKREILVGELAVLRQAALPIVAAVGGMVVPVAIFLAINPSGGASRGWGIPMATDIAFAIGAMVLLADRVPKALSTFLVALAIVDDLGAVLVIAIFYTDRIVTGALLLAGAVFLLLVVLNRAGFRRPLPYLMLGAILWLAMLKSGVHATLAGVLTALTIPARPKYDPERFSVRVKELMQRFDASHRPGKSIMTNEALRATVQTLENGVHRVEAPLQRMEHGLHIPVAFVVIPVFAFFNAGVPMSLSGLGSTLAHPVTLGVMLGLVVGKFVGVTGACWIALKLGVGQLPADTSFAQIAGASLLAGIGFTMAIFIAELGYSGQEVHLLMAKTGILVASLVAGLGGFFWLRWIGAARVKEEGDSPEGQGADA